MAELTLQASGPAWRKAPYHGPGTEDAACAVTKEYDLLQLIPENAAACLLTGLRLACAGIGRTWVGELSNIDFMADPVPGKAPITAWTEPA